MPALMHISTLPLRPLFRRCLATVAGITLATAAATHPARATQATLSHDDLLWLNRITYGADSATAEHLRFIGRRRFLDEQLAGGDDTPPRAVQARIDAMDITRTPATQVLADERAAQQRLRDVKDGDAKVAARRTRNEIGDGYALQATQRHLLRALYSPAQLKEQMDWFWLNHFNVFARKGAVRWLEADYEDRAIRPHALGKFRDLVMATLTHPAMLQYLDNAQNAGGHVNENYARELMELHTLGVDGGYTQHDVQELARVLTGVGVAANANGRQRAGFTSDGLFAFYPARHDFGDKELLGHVIKGRGFAEVEQAVDTLVSQPACARFISRQLAAYFVADDPPPALVDAMARTFQNTGGDISRVLRTLFESREFEASLGKKFKDPMHYIVSSVRLVCDGKAIANEKPVLGWLNGQGENLFGHQSPDGYALTEAAWASSGQMTRRFEIARAIGSNYANVLECLPNPSGDTPKLDNALFAAQIRPYLSKTTLAALDQAKSAREWNALLLASPEWNYR